MEYSSPIGENGTRNSRLPNGVGTGVTPKLNRVVQQIHATLVNNETSGVVIVGPSGSGRRSAFDEAFTRLGGGARLVKLNGSSFGTQVPRGVLSFLLAQLEPEQSATRHTLIHGLADLLCHDGNPSVVLLGRADLVDEESASLIAQLASMRKIKLAVHCAQIRELPRDLLALYRSGQLGHVTVRRMDVTDARYVLTGALGARVSAFAAATLHYLADSNRTLMLQLARTWASDGQLVQRNGVWVLVSARIHGGPALSALSSSMISGLQPRERDLLSALALGGPVPLETVHKAELVREVDALFAAGHIRHDARRVGQVAIGMPLLTLLLRHELQDQSNEGVRHLLQGLHIDAGAAQTLTGLRALVDVGQYEELVRAGESFAIDGYQPAGWLRDPATRVRILNLHVKALLLLGREQDAGTLLQEATGSLKSAMQRGQDARLGRAAQELKLLGARLAPGEQIDSEHNPLGQLPTGSTSWKTESLHLRAAVAQVFQWAAGTRQADALAAIRQISRELQILQFNGHLADTICHEEAAELEAQLLHAELLAGSWKSAMLRASQLNRGKYSNPRITAFAESVRGILLCLAGEAEKALPILQPCLEQLSHGAPGFERAAVEAATTYAMMSLGRQEEGTELLSRGLGSSRPQPSLGFFAWTAEVFASLAVARMDSPASAHTRLEAFAELAAKAGAKSLEMHTAAFELRLGRHTALDRLQSCSAACQGEMAAGLFALAGAVRAEDSAGVAAALSQVAQAGNVLMATASDNALVENLMTREQRRLAKTVAGLRQPAAAVLPGQERAGAETSTPGWTRELTKRESQVALLAIEGRSNQEIARVNGVSIRTVEGHLYQVYSKLQVRNRQELTALDRASRRTAGQR